MLHASLALMLALVWAVDFIVGIYFHFCICWNSAWSQRRSGKLWSCFCVFMPRLIILQRFFGIETATKCTFLNLKLDICWYTQLRNCCLVSRNRCGVEKLLRCHLSSTWSLHDTCASVFLHGSGDMNEKRISRRLVCLFFVKKVGWASDFVQI